MKAKRRKYDRQFKMLTVELSIKRKDIGALAEELDVSVALIYRWRQEFLENKEASFPGNGKVSQTDLEAENTRLRKQLRDAELERDILKKAVGIFSKSDGKYLDS
jgi:transposase